MQKNYSVIKGLAVVFLMLSAHNSFSAAPSKPKPKPQDNPYKSSMHNVFRNIDALSKQPQAAFLSKAAKAAACLGLFVYYYKVIVPSLKKRFKGDNELAAIELSKVPAGALLSDPLKEFVKDLRNITMEQASAMWNWLKGESMIESTPAVH